jgi:hypothetical protein
MADNLVKDDIAVVDAGRDQPDPGSDPDGGQAA